MIPSETFEKTLHDFSVKAANHLYVPGQNMVYSPASLSYAMGMLLEGTAGQSRHEIMTAFFDPNYDGSPEAVEKAANYLMSLTSSGSEGIQKLLTVANFFYSHKDFKLHPVYVNAIQTKYHAHGKELDFVGNNIGALNSINSDVEKATRGLIPQLLDQVPADTKAILVNAIHFKGLWSSPFRKERTADSNFTLTDGTVIKVPTMKQKFDSVPIFKDPHGKFEMIKFPYSCESADESIYMAVVLPRNSTVKDYLNHFDPVEFNKTLNKCRGFPDVHVKLPKFKISSTHALTNTVKELGIGHIFSGQADLSKLTLHPEDRLQVSDILQKAVIEVNEEGTEAAAATAIMMRMCAIQMPKEFVVDRPFLYAIITENKHRQKHIVFIGVVENPLKE